MMTPIRLLTSLSIILGLGFQLSAYSQTTENPASVPTNTVETSQPAAPGETQEATQPAKVKFSLNADTEALKMTDNIHVAAAQVHAHPDDPEAHFLMAAAYSRSPYLDKAFQQMKRVKELLKKDQDFEFIDRTIESYEGLMQTSPDDSIVLYRLAMAYYFKGYSIEKYPQHFKNGPTGVASDYYQKAKDTMSRVIELNPKDTWARNYLGYLISENGKDLAKAIPIWQESLAIDSDTNPGAYLLLGQAYLKQGDLQNALVYGSKGLAIQQSMGMRLP